MYSDQVPEKFNKSTSVFAGKVLVLVLVASVGFYATCSFANTELAASDNDAIINATGQYSSVFGQVRDVVWSDGNRKGPKGSYDFLIVYFRGTEDFGLLLNNNVLDGLGNRVDRSGSSLIGQYIRAEGRIFEKRPNDKNPRKPSRYIQVRNNFNFALVNRKDLPATAQTTTGKTTPEVDPKKQKLLDLQTEINELEREQLVLREQQLDLRLLQQMKNFTDESWGKLQRGCFRLYDNFHDMMINDRTIRNMKNKVLGKELKNYEDYVKREIWRWEQEGRDKWVSKRCGWHFLEAIGEVPNARNRALISFEANHLANPKDDISARMLSLLYFTGRGGFRTEETRLLAAEWGKKADARVAAVAGKLVEPTVGKDGKYTVFDYLSAPESYVPPIPKLPENRAVRVKMGKVGVGSLVQVTVSPFGRWHLTKGEIHYQTDSRARQIVGEDINRVIGQKPLVLECKYNSVNYESLTTKRYWYQKMPDGVDPRYLRSRLNDHPILFIQPPRDSCPPTRAQALQ